MFSDEVLGSVLLVVFGILLIVIALYLLYGPQVLYW